MNTRERNLLIALIVVVVGIGGSLFVWQFFWVPLQDNNLKIVGLKDDNEALEEQLRAFQRDRKKLELARRKSLPAIPAQASSEYIHYLEPLLRDSGLVPEEITPSPATEMKFASTIPGIKKVGHQFMTFQVRAKGELANLVKAMEKMKKTPYEHRIKSFTLVRESMSSAKDASNKLIMSMQIEVLLVSKTDSKPGMYPGIDPKYVALDALAARSGFVPMGWGVLATRLMLAGLLQKGADGNSLPPARRYDDIALKNIFIGGVPYVKKPSRPPSFLDPNDPSNPNSPFFYKGPDPPAEFVPLFVRVMFTNEQDNEVYLRNLVHDVSKIRLIAQKKNYNTFRITDEDKAFSYFEAKVLRIDSRDMYYQVKDKIFCIRTGESFADAMYIPKVVENPKSRKFEEKERERDRLIRTLTAGNLTAKQIFGLPLVNYLSEERIKALDLKKLYDEDWAKRKSVAAKFSD